MFFASNENGRLSKKNGYLQATNVSLVMKIFASFVLFPFKNFERVRNQGEVQKLLCLDKEPQKSVDEGEKTNFANSSKTFFPFVKLFLSCSAMKLEREMFIRKSSRKQRKKIS